MKALLKAIFLISIYFISMDAYSQRILGASRGKNRIKERAEKRARQKAGIEEEKSSSKIFGFTVGGNKDSSKDEKSEKIKDKSTATTSDIAVQEDAINLMAGDVVSSMENVPPPKMNYNFSSSYIMKIVDKTSTGTLQMRTKYLFSEDGKTIGTKELSSDEKEFTSQFEAVIMDFDLNSIYTFLNNDGQKTMMAMSLSSKSFGPENEDAGDMDFTRLGITKNIAGHLCDGYLLLEGTEKSTIWISRFSIPVVSTYYEAFRKMSLNGKSVLDIDYHEEDNLMKYLSEGRAMLGMDSVEENGRETHMEIEEIKEDDPFSISTKDYNNALFEE